MGLLFLFYFFFLQLVVPQVPEEAQRDDEFLGFHVEGGGKGHECINIFVLNSVTIQIETIVGSFITSGLSLLTKKLGMWTGRLGLLEILNNLLSFDFGH